MWQPMTPGSACTRYLPFISRSAGFRFEWESYVTVSMLMLYSQAIPKQKILGKLSAMWRECCRVVYIATTRRHDRLIPVTKVGYALRLLPFVSCTYLFISPFCARFIQQKLRTFALRHTRLPTFANMLSRIIPFLLTYWHPPHIFPCGIHKFVLAVTVVAVVRHAAHVATCQLWWARRRTLVRRVEGPTLLRGNVRLLRQLTKIMATASIITLGDHAVGLVLIHVSILTRYRSFFVVAKNVVINMLGWRYTLTTFLAAAIITYVPASLQYTMGFKRLRPGLRTARQHIRSGRRWDAICHSNWNSAGTRSHRHLPTILMCRWHAMPFLLLSTTLPNSTCHIPVLVLAIYSCKLIWRQAGIIMLLSVIAVEPSLLYSGVFT